MKISKLLPIITFFLILYGISAWTVIKEDKTYSSTENRMLQQFPKISSKRIFNGKFQEKYEIYLSDQFPERDTWIQVKSRTERLAGKTESNGVYFGKQGYLLEKYTEEDFDKKQIKKNIRALKNFINSSDVPIKVMIVPSKTDILNGYLPAFAESYPEYKLYERIEKILPKKMMVSVKETLENHNEEYIYYRNDHHWTTLGAWYGYQAYLQSYGEELKEKQEEIEKEAEKKKQALKTVSTNFLGTTYSKVNMYSKKDDIMIYEPEGTFSVVYNLGEKTEDTFYQWGFLKKKDQYSVFSGGNQGVLEITGGEKNGKTLMVVKDSFANCMIPFFMEDYEKLIVVDMRHLNAGLSMVMRMYQPTDILVLYNLVQFMQDRDFAMKQ